MPAKTKYRPPYVSRYAPAIIPPPACKKTFYRNIRNHLIFRTVPVCYNFITDLGEAARYKTFDNDFFLKYIQ
jgi:hypothetical protein